MKQHASFHSLHLCGGAVVSHRIKHRGPVRAQALWLVSCRQSVSFFPLRAQRTWSSLKLLSGDLVECRLVQLA